MIPHLKEMLNYIVLSIEKGDTSAAMREIALFTELFDQFLQQNQVYIFSQEVQNLNNCIGRMMDYLERGDLVSLKEVITNSFMGYLDNWDFNNHKYTN
ncbi:hypothetical protein [Desulforamulus aeronauticus]|uniref:Uncharacterized protein n=1 Tax=Desulforamulus aeronauticus DSM 10349 TaxID=1121421 RepID=A0A1M6RDH9_9FIRM|nr:hypothetical protein [Desulforamulus aeronauticus]SHK30524.1 hypothetical protein SAMN02745123_01439 [Desulforamulus aeronauticus DSM 10349]